MGGRRGEISNPPPISCKQIRHPVTGRVWRDNQNDDMYLRVAAGTESSAWFVHTCAWHPTSLLTRRSVMRAVSTSPYPLAST